MRDALSGSFDPSSNLNLSKIGITTDPKTGELKIDDAKLSKALSENLDGVKSLFTSGTGIGSRVDTAANAFTKADGIFSTTTEGLNKTITDIKKQYDATSDRIDQRMETYRAQFTQLDAMVSQMNSLSSYLSQQLSALNGSKNSK
jgi:flagellar hook-associated protein 2